ncbi:hypothetical protein [Muribaculum sp.]|uniref:hypothetical protein n=1 Tax=Muribaculum sp. TaxID=1918611 RepID=UPI0023CD3869|nr:hypothetical protein [Muribaculum sp.]MDE5705667.1 hypothetical protein [Muribaculum sp.]
MKWIRVAFIASVLSVGMKLSATSVVPIFGEWNPEVPGSAGMPAMVSAIPVSDANSVHVGGRSNSGSDIAADYDLCYFWLESNGAISNTWETSIIEITARGIDGEYDIKNMFADTFRPEGDNSFVVNDIEASYDTSTGLLDIVCGQHLFDYKLGDKIYPISLLALRKGDKGWTISEAGTLRLLHIGSGFTLYAESDVVGFYLGMIDPDTKRISGFGGAIYPKLHEFNGVMIYMVTADMDAEMLPVMNNIYSYVENDRIYIDNFANFGYHVTVAMEYDTAKGIAWTYDAKLDELQNLDGGMTPFYAANSLYGSADYGMPVFDDYGRYCLSASIVKDNLGNSVLQIPIWGAYIEHNTLALYGSTNIMLFYQLQESLSGIDGISASDIECASSVVYYDLQGHLVSNPIKGRMYVRVAGNQVDKLIY